MVDNSTAEKREAASSFEEKRRQPADSPADPSGAGRPVRRSALTGVRILEWLLDPLVAVASLKLLMLILDVEFNNNYLMLSVLVFILTFSVFREFDVCRSWRYGGVSAQMRDTVVAWLIVFSLILFIGYITKSSSSFSRTLIITWGVVTPVLLLSAHAALRAILFRIGASQRFSRTAVVVGVNTLGLRLANEMKADLRLNMNFCGFFDDRDFRGAARLQGAPYLGALAALPAYVSQHGVDVIYITLPMAQQKRILDLLDRLRDTTVSIYFVPDLFISDLIQARMDDVNGLPVVAVCETPFYGVNALLKRSSDLLMSSLLLILLSPLLLLIAIAVKVTSPGPVLFKQRRYGLDGEEITVYKFRSMRVMEDGPEIVQATKDDARITWLGRYLRRYSLDELPQLINVLQGRMSMVGPRPHAVAHNEIYRRLIKGYMVRHKVKPGITGWAAVNGLRGETETVEKMRKRIEYDLDYLRNWSPWLDLKIILKTAVLMFHDQQAY